MGWVCEEWKGRRGLESLGKSLPALFLSYPLFLSSPPTLHPSPPPFHRLPPAPTQDPAIAEPDTCHYQSIKGLMNITTPMAVGITGLYGQVSGRGGRWIRKGRKGKRG